MLTDLEITLLNLTAASPCTRADLEHQIEQRALRDWLVIGSSSIPMVLRKLKDYQLIYRDDSGNGEPVYTITEGGRGVLQTAMTEMLRQPTGMGERFELALTNLDVLTPAQVFQAVSQRKLALRSRLSLLHARLDETKNDTQRLLLEHSMALAEADLNWVSNFLQHWATRYPAVNLENEALTDPNDNLPATVTHRATDAKNPGKQLQYMRLPPEG